MPGSSDEVLDGVGERCGRLFDGAIVELSDCLPNDFALPDGTLPATVVSTMEVGLTTAEVLKLSVSSFALATGEVS